MQVSGRRIVSFQRFAIGKMKFPDCPQRIRAPRIGGFLVFCDGAWLWEDFGAAFISRKRIV
jgi:hypothetical protein